MIRLIAIGITLFITSSIGMLFEKTITKPDKIITIPGVNFKSSPPKIVFGGDGEQLYAVYKEPANSRSDVVIESIIAVNIATGKILNKQSVKIVDKSATELTRSLSLSPDGSLLLYAQG